ncbi:MAG: serine hydrolase [Anaerolineae bacterium]|nr:serine hydrolase [Anaerolineae bacterium]
MKRAQVILLVVGILLAMVLSPAVAQDEVYFPTAEWRISTPEAQGMDSAELAGLFAQFAQDQFMDSMLVIRHGTIVAEAYAAPFEQDLRHEMWSASKSVTSALIGILLRDGYLDSVDTPVLSLFPDRTFENMDANKEALTVRHLLMMGSGFTCDAFMPEATGDAIFASDDWLDYTLGLPMMVAPGTEFHYCNPNTYVLSAIVTKLTGMSALDFAAENLFTPLGITDYTWVSNPQGQSVGFAGLQLTTRDMAKFGYLYMNDGMWQGEQIIPADYVAESLSTQIAPPWPDTTYGYQWWNIVSANTWFALGRAGQYIVLAPDKDLLVVMTGGGINETIRPYIQGYPLNYAVAALTVAEGALPENPQAVSQLEAQIAQIETPAAVDVAALPDVAALVSGKTYALLQPISMPVPSALGLRDHFFANAVSFDFTDAGQANLTLVSGDGESWTVPVALDGQVAAVDSPLGLISNRGEWHTDDELTVWMEYVGDGQIVRFDFCFMPGALETHINETVGGFTAFSVGVMQQ